MRDAKEYMLLKDSLNLIAQSVLDFAAMLVVHERGEKPATYRELARWLAERISADSELKEFLDGLAGFRNVLVHLYAIELEIEAFKEIKEKIPKLITLMRRVAGNDPCLEDVAGKVVRLAENLKLKYVIVFGSLARRGCGHDVDLFVKLGRKPRSLLEIGRLQAIFEEAVQAPVDLVVFKAGVDPLLAKTIVDEAVILYGDRDEAERDLVELYKTYLDYMVFAERVVLPRGRATREIPR